MYEIILDVLVNATKINKKKEKWNRSLIYSFYFSVDVIFPCNSNCTCVDDASFDPVCANGTSYYSACHAGCMHFDAQERVSWLFCARVFFNNTHVYWPEYLNALFKTKRFHLTNTCYCQGDLRTMSNVISKGAGVSAQRGGCLSRGCLPGGVSAWGCNIFTSMCQQFCPGGVSAWGMYITPRGQNSWHTLVKTLPLTFPQLPLRTVIIRKRKVKMFCLQIEKHVIKMIKVLLNFIVGVQWLWMYQRLG